MSDALLETGASQLASLRGTLDQRMQRRSINDMPGMRAAWEKGNEWLRKQIDLLAEQERMLRRGAEAESEAATSGSQPALNVTSPASNT